MHYAIFKEQHDEAQHFHKLRTQAAKRGHHLAKSRVGGYMLETAHGPRHYCADLGAVAVLLAGIKHTGGKHAT